MFEKYIKIIESNIIAKQSSGGVWYCSELPAKNTKDLEVKIGEVNTILNKYNAENKQKSNGKVNQKK